MKIFRHTLAAAIAAAILPLSAAAVSLGELTVESRPGEPLDAVLCIDDVDLTVSPLLVRVAPPATYLREGVQWPAQAQDLRITKDRAASGMSVRVVGDAKLEGSFPLLIELNAGGSVSVRQYQISAVDGAFEVTPVAERTTVTPPEVPVLMPGEAAAPAKASEAPAAEKTAPEAQPQNDQKKRTRQGRWAPNVVKEYVAVHGFDAAKPFVVGRDMTLWSIAKLYQPGFEGATMEQILSAFMTKNPAAFPQGNAGAMIVGSRLTPPSADEVFAVDPTAAFRKMRGEEAQIPPVTQQLIEAQRHSRALAAEVARAQQAERSAGRGPDAAAAAGAAVLKAAENAAQAPSTASPAMTAEPSQPASENASEKAGPAPEGESVPEAEAEAAADPQAAPVEAATAPEAAEADQEPEQTPADQQDAPAEAASAPEASNAPSAEAQDKSGFDMAWLALAAVLAAILGVLFILRRRGSDQGASPDAGEHGSSAKGPSVVKIAREVPKTSSAQITALKATVDECVKNGTTGGAMGAGAMAYHEAQMAEAKQQADLYEKQPWLVPDEGLEAVASPAPVQMTPRDAQLLSEAAEAVSALDLAQKEASGAEDGKPLFRVSATMRPAPNPAPAQAPEIPAAPRSAKEQALTESMDAQLKLAESFIGLGALPEALELLGEVRRHGLPAQQERAAFLEERIRSSGKNR